MEVYGKSIIAEPRNVIFLSSILNRDEPVPSHKCDKRCETEHVCANIYRCKLTGITHICDKNCNQRILYDNHNSLCRVSGQIFPLTPAEEQAVRGIRRKFEAENSDGCAFKRRRDAQLHPSPFERSFSAVSPICGQVGDGMDMRREISTASCDEMSSSGSQMSMEQSFYGGGLPINLVPVCNDTKH